MSASEAEMFEALRAMPAEQRVQVPAGKLLELLELAQSHREMVPRMQALELAVLQLQGGPAH